MMKSNCESNHVTLTVGSPRHWLSGGLRTLPLLAIIVFGGALVVGCGGGSSGTGETGVGALRPSEGQIVDSSCNPVPDVDLPSLGIGAIEDVSGEDGSFTLDPNAPQQVPGSPGASSPELDSTKANCIVIVYDNGTVVSTNVYPLAQLPECSIEGLQGVVPEEDLPSCGDK